MNNVKPLIFRASHSNEIAAIAEHQSVPPLSLALIQLGGMQMNAAGRERPLAGDSYRPILLKK